MVGGQVLIIFFGGKALKVVPLDGVQWAISIILGLISLPIAVLIRLIPDAAAARVAPKFMTRKRGVDKGAIYVTSDQDERFEWNRGIEEIRTELSFLRLVRGGRLNQLKFRQQNVREKMKENFSHMFGGGSRSDVSPDADGTLPSNGSNRRTRSHSNSAFAAAAMVPAIVAGGIGGWSPVERAPSTNSDLPTSRPESPNPPAAQSNVEDINPRTN